jgi:hypothetical protein
MLKVCFLHLFLILPTCNKMHNDSLSIQYFNSGKTFQIVNYNNEELLKSIEGLIQNVEQRIQLIVSPKTIDATKNDSECTEITFNENITLKSKRLGTITMTKLLIPLSGKYVGDERSPSVIIFIANKDGYITGPLGCSNCLQYINDIKKAIGKP